MGPFEDSSARSGFGLWNSPGQSVAASVGDQGPDGKSFELVPAIEEFQLDQERYLQDFRAEFFDEGGGRRGSAPGSQQIVDEQDTAAGLERIDMYANDTATIFQVIFLLMGLVRQLSLLADGYETSLQLEGGGCGKNKATGINADDRID